MVHFCILNYLNSIRSVTDIMPYTCILLIFLSHIWKKNYPISVCQRFFSLLSFYWYALDLYLKHLLKGTVIHVLYILQIVLLSQILVNFHFFRRLSVWYWIRHWCSCIKWNSVSSLQWVSGIPPTHHCFLPNSPSFK